MATREEQVVIQTCKTQYQYNLERELAKKRLPNRLAYILRYGALKEGLEVDHNGYVELNKLCEVNLLQDYTTAEVLTAIQTSVGLKNIHRYNWRKKDGKVYVRASYHRNIEKNPCHHGSKVRTLFESSMTYILEHLDDYDLEDFPDEYIIRTMIHRLKRQKKLNSKALKTLLVPTLTCLDLEGVFLTKNVLHAVCAQCPDLLALSLKDCGYIVTDGTLTQLTKNLPKLQSLNLRHCSHLTPKFLTILSKNLPHLRTLHMARGPPLTVQTLFEFMKSVKELQLLDVYYFRTEPEEFHRLKEVAKENHVQLILREPKGSEGEESAEAEHVEGEINNDVDDYNYRSQAVLR